MITFVKDCEVAVERGNVDYLKAQESKCHQGAARGGPVVLRPVTATPCYVCVYC